MNKKVRSFLAPVLLLITLSACVYYLANHRSLVSQLLHTPARVSMMVLVLNVALFGALLLILSATINICGKKIKRQENTLLNAHSLFINFFVPGQTGPAYRGVYLFKRHKLKIKNFITVTLVYYAFYAVVSVFLLLLGVGRWWQTLLAVALSAGFGAFVIAKYSRRAKTHGRELNFSRSSIAYLLAATVLQSIIQIFIYAVELHSVNSHIRFSQIITYTGAANLALFVALTPGAIGIRESFLIFTERLHHISSANIVVANVIDRSVYLVFLIGLLVLIIGLHSKGKVHIKRLPALIKQSLKLSYLYKS